MKYNKGFIGIGVIIAIIAVVAVGGGAVYFATKTPAPSSNTEENNYQPQANQNSTIPPTTNTQAQNSNPATVSTPTLTVVSPNGGETLKAGGTYKIKWQASSSFSSDYSKVSITLVGGSRDQAITPDQTIITNNTGSYEWTIPNVQLSTYIQDVSGGPYTLKNISGQNQFKFLIAGYPSKSMRAEGPLDYSNNYFTITSPSVSTSNFKTYANTKYGFEFQYPSTWKECDNNTLQKSVDQNSKYVRTICIYDPSFVLQADTGVVKSVVFYVDESEQYGTFGTLRNTLQADHQRAINLGLYSTFAEKILGGRSFLHAGAGDVGSWGKYYGLLDVKTTQKTYLVAKYANAIIELEKILSSLKTKEDNFNF